METLDELGLRFGTDQASSFHDYCRTMEEFLAPKRHLPIVLMEQGVLGGAGLRMWSAFFTHPDARIIGVDPNTFDREDIKDSRVIILQGSQTDGKLMRWVFEKFGPLDWCTDDASHFASAQQEAFRISWACLKPGGYWCCQDLHTYAAPELSDAPENVMQWLSRIATEMQGRGAEARGRVEGSDVWHSIQWMMFRKGMCIVKKAK